MSIHENLRRIREERGIPESEAAEAIGISLRSYKNLEKGERRLRIGELITLTKFLDTSADDILGTKIGKK